MAIEWKIIVLDEPKIIKFYCKEDVNMVLLEGTAEVDGLEIPLSKYSEYVKGFFGTLYTFNHCKLQYHGDLTSYISSFYEENSNPNVCVNIHTCLKTLRLDPSRNKIGPKLMICGNNGYGKKRLCRTLINYQLRNLEKVLYIDAELSWTDLCIPGSISATVVTHPYNILDGWPISDDMVTFNYGHSSGIIDPELFILQLRSLSELVDKKIKNDTNLNESGFIMNMDSLNDEKQGSVELEQRANIIHKCINLFQIDYVIVIEDSNLEEVIRKDLNINVTIIKIPIPLQSISSYENEDEMHGRSLLSYFTGLGNIRIHLRTFVLFQKKFHVYRIVKPVSENEDRLTEPIELEMTRHLIYSQLAVSQAKKPQDISNTPIYGYVTVIDMIPKVGLKILSPAAEPLLSTILFYNNIKSAHFY